MRKLLIFISEINRELKYPTRDNKKSILAKWSYCLWLMTAVLYRRINISNKSRHHIIFNLPTRVIQEETGRYKTKHFEKKSRKKVIKL